MTKKLRNVLAGLLAGLWLAAAPPAFATAQAPDYLVLDGERVELDTNPLSELLRAKRIKLPESGASLTSNWRGYIAHWQIKDDRLWLTRIDVRLRPQGAPAGTRAEPTDVLQQVFPGQAEVPADWYTGTFVIPRGKVVEYVHLGYGTTHERYTLLYLRSGRVLARENLGVEAFMQLRKQRFAAYQRTAQYAEDLKEARKDRSEGEAERFLYEYSVEEYMSAPP